MGTQHCTQTLRTGRTQCTAWWTWGNGPYNLFHDYRHNNECEEIVSANFWKHMRGTFVRGHSYIYEVYGMLHWNDLERTCTRLPTKKMCHWYCDLARKTAALSASCVQYVNRRVVYTISSIAWTLGSSLIATRATSLASTWNCLCLALYAYNTWSPKTCNIQSFIVF